MTGQQLIKAAKTIQAAQGCSFREAKLIAARLYASLERKS